LHSNVSNTLHILLLLPCLKAESNDWNNKRAGAGKGGQPSRRERPGSARARVQDRETADPFSDDGDDDVDVRDASATHLPTAPPRPC
jgi:hypothetical protein